MIIGCPVQLIREVFSRLHLSSTHICLTLRRLLTFCLTLTGSVFVELSSKAFNNLSKVLLRIIKPSYFSMARHCLWKMCATAGARINETELLSSAAVVPQGESTELCSPAAVMPQRKSLSCVARRPLCLKANLLSCVARRPLCNKVNLPRCEAWQRHFIMTCDISGAGQTNI